MKNVKKIGLIIFLVFIFAFQIIYLKSSGGGHQIDKFYHFSVLFILCFLFFINGFSLKNSFFLCVLCGILMELIQIPIPYRDANFFDFLVGAGGSGFFVLSYSLLKSN